MVNYLFGPPGTMTTYTGNGYAVNPDQTPWEQTTEGKAAIEAQYNQQVLSQTPPTPKQSVQPNLNQSVAYNISPNYGGLTQAAYINQDANLTQTNWLSDIFTKGPDKVGDWLSDFFSTTGTMGFDIIQPLAGLFGGAWNFKNMLTDPFGSMGSFDMGLDSDAFNMEGLFGETGSFDFGLNNLFSSDLGLGNLSMDFNSLFSGFGDMFSGSLGTTQNGISAGVQIPTTINPFEQPDQSTKEGVSTIDFLTGLLQPNTSILSNPSTSSPIWMA